MRREKQKTRSAWTLAEMAVVLALFGLLVCLLLPALGRAREIASRLICCNNLRQLGIAVHCYHHDKGAMPPYASGKPGELYGSWFTHLLPYVGYSAIYKQICDERAAVDDGSPGFVVSGPGADGIHDAVFPLLLCPSDPSLYDSANRTWSKTNYLANWYALSGGAGGLYAPARSFKDLTDGLANGVLFAEAYACCDGVVRVALISGHYHNFGLTQDVLPSDDPIYLPNEYTMFQVRPGNGGEPCHKWRTQTPHQAMPVLLADGSLRLVNGRISIDTWKKALKPADGHMPGDDWQ